MARYRISIPWRQVLRALFLPLMLVYLLAGKTSASVPDRIPASFTSIALAPGGGFWVQITLGGNDGETLALDGAPQYESVPESGTIVAVPGTHGYWVVTPNGFIYSRGGAPELCDGYLGDCSGFGGGDQFITGVATSPKGDGFWAVDNERHVWTAGNVRSYGDATSDNQTPSGIVATPSGHGYYIVMTDGGVHARGDAVFFGSTGGHRPGGHDISGLALSYDLFGKVDGYWLLADDGAIYTYGDAPFLGNGGVYPQFASNLVTLPDQHSYAWVFADGRVGTSKTLAKVSIMSENFGNVWTVPVMGNALYMGRPTSFSDDDWLIWPTNDAQNVVQIVNVANGYCADVSGTYLIAHPCKTKTQDWDNQRFTLQSDGAGHVQILPVAPANTVVYSRGPLGSRVDVIPYQGGWAAGWILVPVE